MVQVLKEELRQAIIRHAQDEFFQYGYAAASVKRIAAKAGISVGNLYRYYSGKDILFEAIVAPVYLEWETLISHHAGPLQRERNVFELVVEALTHVVGEYRIPLLILIDGTGGTRYENAVSKFHQMMADNVAHHLAQYNGNQKQEVFDRQTAWPVAVAFMQGYFEIIRSHPDSEDCKHSIRQYILFWYQGLRAFLS
ncbi:TetR/AcrR family transcriptional regulator [Paenibacillus hodogayensis]|uniref:TetR/AcrR family transcriptional regulator n=1 Tax=Paenibacillus hodogayensis TaxID=279208 RepID=A0ABV5VV32_9BACL